METILNTENIMFAMWVLTIIFGVFFYFRNPQEALDKQQDLDRQEVDGQIKLFDERFKWNREDTEKKFKDISERMDRAMTIAENHTHTVDVKVDHLIGSVNQMNLQLTNAITRLETTINERIPKK